MNENYVTSLMRFSETNRDAYQSVLKNYQNEIIDTSGGLDAMIALCLTNPEFSTNKYKTQFDSFKSLMESKNINVNNDDNIECDVAIKYKNDSDTDKAYTTISNIHTSNTKKNTSSDVIFANLGEFCNCSFGLIAYHSDNVYFSFLSTKANYIFHHV